MKKTDEQMKTQPEPEWPAFTPPACSVLDLLKKMSAALTAHPLYEYYRENLVEIGPMTTEIAEAGVMTVPWTYRQLQRLHKKGIIQKDATPGGVTRWFFDSQNGPFDLPRNPPADPAHPLPPKFVDAILS